PMAPGGLRQQLRPTTQDHFKITDRVSDLFFDDSTTAQPRTAKGTMAEQAKPGLHTRALLFRGQLKLRQIHWVAILYC
ncbi:MAG: hypothetical protein ACKO2T_25965, partial [Microcystis aeruginosa]